MKGFTKIVAASVLAISAASVTTTASAMPFDVSGEFTVRAVNVTNLSRAESRATLANFNAAVAGTLGTGGSGDAPVFNMYDFLYTGALNFSTSSGSTTTISQWLATGTPGGVIGLDATFGGLQQSKGDIDSTTATTTFYLFQATLGALTDITVRHDDGFAAFDDGTQIGGVLGPTVVQTNSVADFDGGVFSLLYVATNSDPSILRVQAIPLPAAAWMLFAAAGGLIAAKRRRAAQA